MKRAAAVIICYLIVLLTAFLPDQKTAAPSKLLPSPLLNQFTKSAPGQVEPPETRALWVVRSTLSSPEAVKELVRRAKENGFTDLVAQVRGRGDAYYASRLEPRAEDLANQPPDFDPLAMTIDEAHRVGIKVHAWINIYLVANVDGLPKSKDHLIYRHPDWLMVPRGLAAELYNVDPKSPDYLDRIIEFIGANRKELEGVFVSPANPQVKENIYGIWMDVAEKYEVDGLHFDYVRYPNPQFDYSRSSLDRFYREAEKDLDAGNREFLAQQAANDPLIYATTLADRYAQYQRDQVTDLVERIYKGVKKVKPHAIVSAAVFANDEDAARSRFQDWKLWLRRGWLDVLCPMAYTTDTENFRKLIVTAMNNSSGKRVWGGIGAFKQPAASALEKIQVTRDLKANGFILFSYDSSIKVSDINPQGDYLERMRDGLRTGFDAGAQQR